MIKSAEAKNLLAWVLLDKIEKEIPRGSVARDQTSISDTEKILGGVSENLIHIPW